MENASRSQSLRAGGRDDPDATHAAAVLSAYFTVEQASTFRRRVWYAVAVIGLGLWTLNVTTSALTRVDIAFGALLTGGLAAVAMFAEVRARARLERLLSRH